MDDYIKLNFCYEKGTKEYFQASLCKDGVLGGCIIIGADVMTYRSEKITISDKYKNLEMRYKDIITVNAAESLLWSTITLQMKSGEEYKFSVHDMEEFINVLRKKGVNI